MNRIVVFRRTARMEFDEAVAWYESERAGLGLEFKSVVDDTLLMIARQPMLFRRVRGEVRRAVVKRFPYSVHFLPEGARVVVLAVYHSARNPRELGRRE
jgi:plasmid stabilization system protein ParE